MTVLGKNARRSQLWNSLTWRLRKLTGWRTIYQPFTKLAMRLAPHYSAPGSLKEPIFILGCSRSGTTVIDDYFSLHPDVVPWSIGEASRIWRPDLSAQSNDVMEPEDATQEDRKRIENYFQWLVFLVPFKRRFVNKNTRNAVRIRWIKALFPDSKIIYIDRDGRAVTNSIANMTNNMEKRQSWPMGRFTKPPNWQDYLSENLIEQSAKQWLYTVRRAEWELSQMPEGSYLRIRYEDFCDSPRTVISNAWKYCGLNPKPRLLERIPEQFENRNYKWKDHMSAEDAQLVEALLIEDLIKMGFERAPAQVSESSI